MQEPPCTRLATPSNRRSSDLPPLSFTTFGERFSGGATQGRSGDPRGKKVTAEQSIVTLRGAETALSCAPRDASGVHRNGILGW
jgi:hypothetical protein